MEKIRKLVLLCNVIGLNISDAAHQKGGLFRVGFLRYGWKHLENNKENNQNVRSFFSCKIWMPYQFWWGDILKIRKSCNTPPPKSKLTSPAKSPPPLDMLHHIHVCVFGSFNCDVLANSANLNVILTRNVFKKDNASGLTNRIFQGFST